MISFADSTHTTTRNPQQVLTELQARIFHESRSNGRPIRQLMTWVLDQRNLDAAWDRIRQTEGANTPGVDGVTASQINNRSSEWLGKLADDLYHRCYRPLAPRWVDIPKDKQPGTFRRLGILTLRDRVVHAALKQVLEPILEPIFFHNSYGFRPGRSVTSALFAAMKLLSSNPEQTSRFEAVAQLDIANCFDTIDHQFLLEEISRHVADPEILTLMESIFQAGGQQNGRLWWKRTCGLVQGSSLSPLLCNLALHPLDQALHDFGQASLDGLRMLRYADDLLLVARDVRLAEKAIALTRQVLRRLQQQLGHRCGTAQPSNEGVNWLGVRIQPRSQSWLGYTEYCYVVPEEKILSMLQRITEMTTPPSNKIDGSAFNLSRWIVSINEQLRDWRQAYLYSENGPEVFRTLDEHTKNRVASLLQSVTGSRWNQLQNQYRVRLPRGFWTWEYQGARLTVLSSLAPHAPTRLTRQPAWMHHKPGKQPLPEPQPEALPALPPPTTEQQDNSSETDKET